MSVCIWGARSLCLLLLCCWNPPDLRRLLSVLCPQDNPSMHHRKWRTWIMNKWSEKTIQMFLNPLNNKLWCIQGHGVGLAQSGETFVFLFCGRELKRAAMVVRSGTPLSEVWETLKRKLRKRKTKETKRRKSWRQNYLPTILSSVYKNFNINNFLQ